MTSTVDSDGDTITDWTETATCSYAGSQNLTTIATAIDGQGDGSVDDTRTTTASYSTNTLTGFSEVDDLGNDGSTDYQMDTIPTFNALGMPVGSQLERSDRPVVLPVQSEMLH